jgi:hypothetical protein
LIGKALSAYERRACADCRLKQAKEEEGKR